jgi:3-oxoacyl-[acyl-carrier-protein] synthase I
VNEVRVAITGLGAVCAAGKDVAGLEAALSAPASVFGPSRRHAMGFEVTVGEVREEWFAAHGHAELDSPTGRLCLAAARECASHARSLGAGAPDGLALGTSTGGQSANEEMIFALLEGRATPAPYGFRGRGCMAAPSRLVARDLDLRGPVSTVSTACTSSANAIALGASWIRGGRCRRVLAGGGDALCHTTISTFHILELTGLRACAPFGPDRPGLTLGEGAGFLMLERLDDVLAAGRAPLALLLGSGMSSDAHHMTAPPADGAGAELAMRRALDDAGLSPAQVHHVNAHGTGTRLNDAAEASAISRLLGTRVPVASCKGLVGHTLGGAGAIEAVASVLSVVSRRAFENVGAVAPGDDCPIALVGPGGAALPGRPVVLSNSFAFGGNNCALVLGAATGGAP